jgi:hypothetical protein
MPMVYRVEVRDGDISLDVAGSSRQVFGTESAAKHPGLAARNGSPPKLGKNSEEHHQCGPTMAVVEGSLAHGRQ